MKVIRTILQFSEKIEGRGRSRLNIDGDSTNCIHNLGYHFFIYSPQSYEPDDRCGIVSTKELLQDAQQYNFSSSCMLRWSTSSWGENWQMSKIPFATQAQHSPENCFHRRRNCCLLLNRTKKKEKETSH
jgi:hypothetical protein